MSFYDIKRVEEEVEPDYDYDDDDYYDEEYDPTCDHCGGLEIAGSDDWNPETGNHKSCDYKEILEKVAEGTNGL